MTRFIGAASGWGAQILECEEGPVVLSKHLPACVKKSLIFPRRTALERQGVSSQDIPQLIEDFNRRLSFEVFSTLKQKEFPIVFGGDHSIAVGTWNGVHCFLSQQDSLPLGLIWLDAHLDSHIPETSPSHAWHGMPLAGLLGYGHSSMSQLLHMRPIMDPKNIIIIGVRSYEKEERAFLQDLGVSVYELKNVHCIKEVLLSAYLKLSSQTKAIGLSLDLDVIDPNDAPAVGSPEAGGIYYHELKEALVLLKEKLVAFELVEFNPKRDVADKTLRICLNLLHTLFIV